MNIGLYKPTHIYIYTTPLLNIVYILLVSNLHHDLISQSITLTSYCLILIMTSTWRGTDKYQSLNHSVVSTWVPTFGFESHHLPNESQTLNSVIPVVCSPLPIEQHYTVNASVACFKSVPILIWLCLLPGHNAPANN